MIVDKSVSVNDHRQVAKDDPSFSDKLGLALANFLKVNGISEAEASRRFGIERGTLNTYTSGVKGERRKIPAEVLAKACLLGFEFEFEGHIIVATKDGQRLLVEDKQLHLEFSRELDLTGNGGTVAVGLKRPPGRVALTVSLKAMS
jgi:hypothetical protein